jgi:uncharacterized protein involved in response to NO
MNNDMSVWHYLAAAPHRAMFLAGALQGVLTLLWWVFDLSGRYGFTGTAPAWGISPVWAHAFLMIYGFFPFFICGFLFTTFPNWMNGEKIHPRYYVSACLLMSAGVALFYLGLAMGESLMAAGVAVLLAGFSIAVYALLHVLIRVKEKDREQDRRHGTAASGGLISGWLGIAAYLLWLLTDNPGLLEFTRTAGIWFFLLPIVMTVSHRMIPFFSSRVLDNYVLVRPYWILWLMLACSVGHGIFQLSEVTSFPVWIFDLTLAACAIYLSFTWGLLRSFRIRLLAVLHIAFAWLGVAMLLYGAQNLVLFTSGGKSWILGLAPLHALAIGYFAGMVLGMASRVTLGHSGRPLSLDKFSWLLFLGFQAAAFFRILPDVIPAAVNLAPGAYLLAGLIWLICFTLWTIRYAPHYWRPRVDSKPG